MDERAVAIDVLRGTGRALLLESGKRRFPILALDDDGCLIAAPEGVGRLRGYADILDGERLVASCLVVFAAPEDGYLRVSFKRRTVPRTKPPADYAAG